VVHQCIVASARKVLQMHGNVVKYATLRLGAAAAAAAAAQVHGMYTMFK
jgi:hypothetical protein